MSQEKDNRMPDPSEPTMGLNPKEAHRFLSHIATGLSLATVLIAGAEHGARSELAKGDDVGDETDAEKIERLQMTLGTVAAVIRKAGCLITKNGTQITGALEGMANAFARLDVSLPAPPDDPAELAERVENGEQLAREAKEWLDKPNDLAAAVICRADNPEARKLAELAGIDPDAQGISSFKLDPDQVKKKKPADKPAPPTWTGRNGSKWKPDGTIDDGSTPNN